MRVRVCMCVCVCVSGNNTHDIYMSYDYIDVPLDLFPQPTELP